MYAPRIQEDRPLHQQKAAAVAQLRYIEESLELALASILGDDAMKSILEKQAEETKERNETKEEKKEHEEVEKEEGKEEERDSEESEEKKKRQAESRRRKVAERCVKAKQLLDGLIRNLQMDGDLVPEEEEEEEKVEEEEKDKFSVDMLEEVDVESPAAARGRVLRALQIANEILQTEHSYVNYLEILISEYYNPTKAKHPDSDMMDIFSNIQSILEFNRQLLSKMTEAWASSITPEVSDILSRPPEFEYDSPEHANRDLELLQECAWKQAGAIGEIILQLAPFLKCYTLYINNYDEAMELLGQCLGRWRSRRWIAKCDKRAQHHLEETRKQERGSDGGIKGGSMRSLRSSMVNTSSSSVQLLRFSDYLIMPIQRVPRYVMLLEQLGKTIPKGRLEKEVVDRATESVRVVANAINETKKRRDDLQRLIAMAETIGVAGHEKIRFNFVKPGRQLIREGKLVLNGKEMYVFLLSDIMLVCETQVEADRVEYSLVQLVQVEDLEVEDLYPPSDIESESETETEPVEMEETKSEEKTNNATPHSNSERDLLAAKQFYLFTAPMKGVKERESQNKTLVTCASFMEKEQWQDAFDRAKGEVAQLRQSTVFRESRAETIDEDMLAPVAIAGWLMKRRDHVRTWAPRFCVLRGKSLLYYMAPKDRSPHGIINLRGCKVNPVSNTGLIFGYFHGGPTAFELIRPYGETRLYFKVCKEYKDTATIWFRLWLSALQRQGVQVDPTIWESIDNMSLESGMEALKKKGYSQVFEVFKLHPQIFAQRKSVIQRKTVVQKK